MEKVLFAQLALLILEKVIPQIKKDPTITVEQQQEIQSRLDNLRSSNPDATGFKGPEWET
jgi:hypothetical protein